MSVYVFWSGEVLALKCAWVRFVPRASGTTSNAPQISASHQRESRPMVGELYLSVFTDHTRTNQRDRQLGWVRRSHGSDVDLPTS
ncbi:hypothetical protein [Ferrimicrobium sp.]|jgi:hypothetical protein